MSQINDLKNKEENKFNFIELIQKLIEKNDNKKDIKYIKMLDRIIKQKLYENIKDNDNYYHSEKTIENIFLNSLYTVISPIELDLLIYFCEKHNNGAISGIDVQTVDIKTIMKIALDFKLKELENIKEKLIEKIYDDDTWLVLLPLNYEASLKYGANTKWCTASKDTEEHYRKYTRNGQLIYIINKVENKKYAFFNDLLNNDDVHFNHSIMSLWDEEDNFIELLYSDLPINIIEIIRDYINQSLKTNYTLSKEKNEEIFNASSLKYFKHDEIIKLVQEGKPIAAITLIKEVYNCSLKEAKKIYDNQYYDFR